jgi:hypothetical protein
VESVASGLIWWCEWHHTKIHDARDQNSNQNLWREWIDRESSTFKQKYNDEERWNKSRSIEIAKLLGPMHSLPMYVNAIFDIQRVSAITSYFVTFSRHLWSPETGSMLLRSRIISRRPTRINTDTGTSSPLRVFRFCTYLLKVQSNNEGDTNNRSRLWSNAREHLTKLQQPWIL